MTQEHPFVQEVIHKLAVSSVILYTEQHVQDIKGFCRTEECTVLGFDKTFNMGKVFVTATVYKNMSLSS